MSSPHTHAKRRRVFTVAAAQMVQRRDMAEAARAVATMVARAGRLGARFLVTPEMILTGYHGGFDQATRDRLIEQVIRPACARHRVALILGAGSYRSAAGRRSARPFIQATVIDASGNIIGAHDKVIPTAGDLKWCARGAARGLRVFRSEGLPFGVTICNDFWATPLYTTLPDLNLPSLLARKKARVIFHVIASGTDRAYLDFHTRRMEERAIRAGVWVVSANCARDRRTPCNAPTGIVDPAGTWRVSAPLAGEHLVTGRITIYT
jgi:predicted amidohydrolase